MIGQTLNNRYKIISQLGEGGMGEVYLANDEQTGNQVAVKILARQLTANPEALERFKREGETLRQLDHPNIVKFIDAFEYERQYVIVMEYISSGNLQDLIKKGALPIDQARQITLDLCDALIRAHRLNIIHRDIKPENVLITENGIPKLADFGVARLSESTSMTRSGTQVGTPYYMAPEAWEGKTLDAQADIWSLGVMLFEMVAGKVPFGGETGAAVMNKILTTQPPDIRKLRADAPTHLIKIIRKMLTRDKKNRYSTMRQVAVELEQEQQSSSIIKSKTNQINQGNNVKVGTWSLIGLLGVLLSIFLVIRNSNIESPQSDVNTSTENNSTSTSQVIATKTFSIPETARPSSMNIEGTLYDDFNNEFSDSKFDRSLWDIAFGNLTIPKQLNGQLIFSEDEVSASTREIALNAKAIGVVSLNDIKYIQADLGFGEDTNSLFSHIAINIVVKNTSKGDFWIEADLLNSTDHPVILCKLAYFSNNKETKEYEYIYEGGLEYGQLYSIRIEINPDTFEVVWYLNNTNICLYKSKELPELIDQNINVYINSIRGKGAYAITYLDNVYIAK